MAIPTLKRAAQVKRQFRIYLETSFWRRLADDSYPARKKLSYKFIRSVASKHRIMVSALVRRELDETPDLQERKHGLRRMKSFRMRTLTTTRRTERMALDLLAAGGWREAVFEDMMHIAYTISGKGDALVTWDRGRPRSRTVVQAYGRRQNLAVPLIGTPEEVAEWLGIRIRS